jgi:hypothetical protein
MGIEKRLWHIPAQDISPARGIWRPALAGRPRCGLGVPFVRAQLIMGIYCQKMENWSIGYIRLMVRSLLGSIRYGIFTMRLNASLQKRDITAETIEEYRRIVAQYTYESY